MATRSGGLSGLDEGRSAYLWELYGHDEMEILCQYVDDETGT